MSQFSDNLTYRDLAKLPNINSDMIRPRDTYTCAEELYEKQPSRPLRDSG